MSRRVGKDRRRLLFASCHGHIDPSSGAAMSVRVLLQQLAASGWQIRTFCGPLLDFCHDEDVRQILADARLDVRQDIARYGDGAVGRLLTFQDHGVESCVFLPPDTAQVADTRLWGHVYLEHYVRVLTDFQPELILTYGGDCVSASLLRQARQRGIATVFWLQNLAYQDARLFDAVNRVIVPSEFSAHHYRKTLGLECTVLPCPFDWHRISCHASPDERYVTFVNPEPHKGVSVFARIAEQLHLLRPDIPLLVVEGRSGTEWLQRMPLDLSHVTNLSVMKNTPDPRDFLRVSHLLLMPSLCEETFGRVAVEAMINGIPVLASRRGALPEIIGDAGFLFEIPCRYTAANCEVPSAQDVASWVNTIVRLWDDSSYHGQVSQRARKHADTWRPKATLQRYKNVFEDTIGTGR